MAAAAALAFAGKSVATPAISFLVNKGFAYLNEYRKAEGMDELKSRIQDALPQIQTLFDVIDPERIKGERSPLGDLLWQLRDAVEKAEDAVDEVEYHELEEKAKDRKVSDWGSSFSKMKHETVKSVKQSRIVGKAIKSLTHHGTLKRLREAVEGLDKAAAGVIKFLALADHLKEKISQQEEGRDRETGSILTAPEVVGRHEEKESVIGWLTKTSGEDSDIVVSSNNLSLVSIVGHGGMGKTTLAQLICQDDTVTKHFEKVIWACVSTSFDATTVTSKILQNAGWSTPNANTLDALQKVLREKLNTIKFLLVLDDVWDDQKRDQWEKLFAPLRTGKNGSKILLTSRMQSVADLAGNAMGGEKICLPLQGLKEDENIKLFNYHAFPSARFQDYPSLQPIGEQIANKMRGCPLVTKVVASHLRENLTYSYWNNFLDKRLKHFEGSADDIKNVLRLSYYHIAPELQACFRYCSIFPQDYEFHKDLLVEMWVSSGLISPDESQSNLLEIGERCLLQLTRKSFFELKFRNNLYGPELKDNGYYVMHDLMHDLAENVSLGECAGIVDVASLAKVKKTVRHIRIEHIHNFPVEKIKEIACLEKLRTIIINDESWNKQEVNKDILNTFEELVKSSKSLRLFQTKLRHTSDFAGKLGKLQHLRFVGLRQISPESICGIVKLYHLTTLRCNDVKIEPKQLRDIGNLDRLRNVTYGSRGWGEFPVGRLNSLLVLEDYHIQPAKGHKISALKDLGILRRLSLKGLENVGNQEEAKEAKLKEKTYLESLSLKWSRCNDARIMSDELILDNLETHADLKKLYISGFSGSRMPHWIAKPSLRKLELKNCRNYEKLPVLDIQTLKHIKLEDLPRLKKFVSEDEHTELFLPRGLNGLEVTDCPELAELPILPPNLVWLRIVKVGLTKLPRIGERHNGNAEKTAPAQLQLIEVRDCQGITSLEGSLFEQRQYMGALSELRISNCAQLESAPLPFEEMNGLRAFEIAECPKLRARRGAEDNLLPSSVRDLTIGQCGDLELPLLGSLRGGGLTNLIYLRLQNCTSVESLPSKDVFKSLKSLQFIWMIGCGNLTSLGGLGSLQSIRELEIRDCGNLSSLDGLGSLQSISRLEISRCCKLAEAGPSVTRDVSGGEEDHRVEITYLDIDLPSLLLVEPLNSQRHIQHLSIGDGSEMESLPEPWLLQNRSSLKSLLISQAKSLESLPQSMRDLSSLEELSLGGAGQLRSLPDLPSSLQKNLVIQGCNSELEAKFREAGSPERNKISRIRQVQIGIIWPVLHPIPSAGGSYFIMGKKCSSSTFWDLSLADNNTLSSWLSQPEDDHTGSKLCCLGNAS